MSKIGIERLLALDSLTEDQMYNYLIRTGIRKLMLAAWRFHTNTRTKPSLDEEMVLLKRHIVWYFFRLDTGKEWSVVKIYLKGSREDARWEDLSHLDVSMLQSTMENLLAAPLSDLYDRWVNSPEGISYET